MRKAVIMLVVAAAGVVTCATGCSKDNKEHATYQTIHEAVQAGDVQEVSRHLSEGVNVNLRDDRGLTPLHIAAETGQPEMVQLLLQEGAKLDATDMMG